MRKRNEGKMRTELLAKSGRQIDNLRLLT